MKNLLFPIIACLSMMLAMSCDAPGNEPEELDMDAIRAEIQAMEDAYAAASNNNDAEAQVAYYAEDAVSLPPNEPPIEGKAAILANAKEEMAEEGDQQGTIRFEIVDLWAAGDIVVEHGKWINTNPDGTETTGKFITVFEKRDGKYLAVRDIWSPDVDMDDTEDDMEDDMEGDDSEG